MGGHFQCFLPIGRSCSVSRTSCLPQLTKQKSWIHVIYCTWLKSLVYQSIQCLRLSSSLWKPSAPVSICPEQSQACSPKQQPLSGASLSFHYLNWYRLGDPDDRDNRYQCVVEHRLKRPSSLGSKQHMRCCSPCSYNFVLILGCLLRSYVTNADLPVKKHLCLKDFHLER